MLRFHPDQIALCPMPSAHPRAMTLLRKMGMTEWVFDTVTATGTVGGMGATNEAILAFNYQAFPHGQEFKETELEVLKYTEGKNWMQGLEGRVSHLGMHVTESELTEWRKFFDAETIPVVQEVRTINHTNPYLIEKHRNFHYVIFGTRPLLGVDLKFIVRIES